MPAKEDMPLLFPFTIFHKGQNQFSLFLYQIKKQTPAYYNDINFI